MIGMVLVTHGRLANEFLDYSRGEIRLDGLSHHYGRDSGGLDDITLTIRPGEKVGLIGRSGTGKSTLVKLLLRFYDAEQGQILIDGQDIRGVTQDSLRRCIGMVQQDSALLHRSVRDNLLYGRPDASEEQMIAAAQRGDFAPFERLVDVLSRPFDDQPGADDLKRPPEPHEVVRQTFCGT